ncbi:uncharacterized protein LACBIDRAFT_303996 [Laccaria bicolor S238N-H82]|uniref:Predicted protein n=1 Tax=Laccaria bicolor (strain S238N-H82 / ATCC MYA-4686) TaxID=486041 RepID=B0DKQ8_LACBS|nr:uncharacterized protein LACBIDRAFT_303996 [Laccaria bicolor S238N-H82]EDR04783.1 predicted protein [Laccaria bicolor S238N-H82]|eukprot:XP_001884607.1 predicted protein [Laccaria bicolor S238N-H82]
MLSPAIRRWIETPTGTLSLAAIPLAFALYKLLQKPQRLSKVSKTKERVLVLGATSGIGRSIARQYAERGAVVCVVGRRGALVKEVVKECRQVQSSLRLGTTDEKNDFLGVTADFANVDDMVRVREVIQFNWKGLDTIVVAAGVSALQPLMAVAGVETANGGFTPEEATREGIKRVTEVATAAITGNYVGPLIAAVTFIPLLSKTSKSPAITLVSSLASVIAAPTRTIYASTKAASLVLYQALSIEHPNISFSLILPSTVEGDFRASAVDSGPVREVDPNKHGLKREDVARRCIAAADAGEKTVFIPPFVRYGHLLYWIWPSFVEWRARKKYNFGA